MVTQPGRAGAGDFASPGNHRAVFTAETAKALLRKVTDVKGADIEAIEKVLANVAEIDQFTFRLNLIAADIQSSSATLRREIETICTTAWTLTDTLPAHLKNYREDDDRLPYLRALLDAARDVRDRRLPFAISPIEHWNVIAKDVQELFFTAFPGCKRASYRFIAEFWRTVTGEAVNVDNIEAAFKHEETAVKKGREQEIGRWLRRRPHPAFFNWRR